VRRGTDVRRSRETASMADQSAGNFVGDEMNTDNRLGASSVEVGKMMVILDSHR